MTDPAVKAVARAICVGRGINPDKREPGFYTIPYDADYIGKDNAQCDGEEGSPGDNYREPWSFYWRHQGANAMRIIAALREQGWGPITPEMKAVCEAAKEYFDHCINVADGLVDDPTTVNASIDRLEADRNITLQAALVLGRALLKEDGK